MPVASYADPNKIRYAMRFVREDLIDRTYFYLPFNIPEGTKRIEVAYRYSPGDQGDPNIIDIGAFGPGPTGLFNMEHFRGWSGSFRNRFYISQDDSTPGYLRGRVESGIWKVILGLYKISKTGCDCEVEISPLPEFEERQTAGSGHECFSGVASPREIGWSRGDLHVHSVHSDGNNSILELANEARRRGLNYVAITDHNTIAQRCEINEMAAHDLLMFSGQEITTYHGHANVWGNRNCLEFRCQSESDVSLLLGRVHQEGLVFSINHPNDIGPNWEFKALRGFDCLEVWCGLWPRLNFQSLEWWDMLLNEGNRVVGVGGSDLHEIEDSSSTDGYGVGSPTTWIHADVLTSDLLTSSIARGNVFISRDPEGPMLNLEAWSPSNDKHAVMGRELVSRKHEPIFLRLNVRSAEGGFARLVVDGRGSSIARIDSGDFTKVWQLESGTNRYCRMEILSKDSDPDSNDKMDQEITALSNPIYIKRV